LIRRHTKRIKGRIPVWVACFQAMCGWLNIDANEIKRPALLLAGSKNKNVMDWLEEDRSSIARTKVHVEIVDGINHQQEFSQIERLYPIVYSFFNKNF